MSLRFIIKITVILLFLTSCGNVTVVGNLEESMVKKKQINNVKSFTESIIKEYEKIISKNIAPEYRNHFLFYDGNYKAEAIVSSDRE